MPSNPLPWVDPDWLGQVTRRKDEHLDFLVVDEDRDTIALQQPHRLSNTDVDRFGRDLGYRC